MDAFSTCYLAAAKWRAHRPLEPQFARDNKMETPNQTNLETRVCQVLNAFKNLPIHGIPHITVRFAVRCVLHRYSSQGIHRCN